VASEDEWAGARGRATRVRKGVKVSEIAVAIDENLPPHKREKREVI